MWSGRAGLSLPARARSKRAEALQPRVAIGRLSPRRDSLEKTMIRLIAIAAFALAVATSAQAMSPAPLNQADGMITQVRQACGAGMKWNNALGRCATTSARRHVRRGVVMH